MTWSMRLPLQGDTDGRVLCGMEFAPLHGGLDIRELGDVEFVPPTAGRYKQKKAMRPGVYLSHCRVTAIEGKHGVCLLRTCTAKPHRT